MEEAEAAPVRRLEAAAQVVPVPDRVHGLVADDLLQDIGRRRPVDRRSTRKPRLNQDENRWAKSASSASRSGCVLRMPRQLLAHADQRLGAAAAPD